MANITVACPTCKQDLAIDEQYLGQSIECSECNEVFIAKKKPFKMRRSEREDDDDDDKPRRKRGRRDDDEDDYDYSPPSGRGGGGSGTDASGVVGLIFGCIAIVCLLMGCFTCGVTYFAAAPLALVSGIVSFFARGNLKVAGIALNTLALIPGLILLGLLLLGNGAALVAPMAGRR